MSRAINLSEAYRNLQGEIQIIIRDRTGRIVDIIKERNLIKTFAKEMLAHRLPYSKVWDPTLGSGTGGWVDSGVDPTEDFAAKYILLGASYVDATGEPLDTNDSRYYIYDTASNTYVPKKPLVGADNDGDLIHPIPISEPDRPLKRIEKVSFEPSYQPADNPLLDDTVRAVNNVLVLETTLKLSEYNGFGTSNGDFFTITEIALAGGKAINSIGNCECPPKILFLEGAEGTNDQPILCNVGGSSSTITIDGGVTGDDVDRIQVGDQVYIIAWDGNSGTETYAELSQPQPYYLVVAKSPGGHDITLDRTPQYVDGSNNLLPIVGEVGVFKSSLRLFSQRILTTPFKKSEDYEITIRWLIYFN